MTKAFIFRAVTRGCLAVSLAFLAGSVLAQQMYRWKDDAGDLHVTDRPPPSSCASADCLKYRQATDQRLTDERSAREKKLVAERMAKEKQSREDVVRSKNMANTMKTSLMYCANGRMVCKSDEVRAALFLVAREEGEAGVTDALGKPSKIHQVSLERMEWLYPWGVSSMQLVWLNASGKSNTLHDVVFP